jgi:hypothetical protein
VPGEDHFEFRKGKGTMGAIMDADNIRANIGLR